ISKDTPDGDPNYIPPVYPILPFNKHPSNPILTTNPDHDWESAYIYNPTAIVLNETIFLLYRAQNASKTSSIGLAWSTDGVSFTRLNLPIVYATEPWERVGGTEDPRIVRINGIFYLTYTAYDNSTARLCLATSTDLLNWKKYPPLFPNWYDLSYNRIGMAMMRFNWTKSGAIITEPTPDGLYHMYFGDSSIFHATSPDLLNWTASPSEQPFMDRIHPWENRLIEPGPAPIKTRDGRWILIYNGASLGTAGYNKSQYSTGQTLIDPSGAFRPNVDVPDGQYQPALRDGPIARLERPLLWPDADNEVSGQVDLVVFSEGLVQFKGKWYLYYGQGDSELGVAVSDV
ncbi:Arabinanase/levansucrase/invertase, partial [Rhizodiscina lignyota]